MSTRKTTEVNTDDGIVTVHKLALGDYADVFKAIHNLPTAFESLKGLNADDTKGQNTATQIQTLLPVIAESWGDLAGIIAVATDKDKDFILELDLADGMEVLTGVLEVNRIQKIVDTAKKMYARVKAQQTEQAPATSQA